MGACIRFDNDISFAVLITLIAKIINFLSRDLRLLLDTEIFFGELALIADVRRNGDTLAMSNLILLVLSKFDFKTFLRKHQKKKKYIT